MCKVEQLSLAWSRISDKTELKMTIERKDRIIGCVLGFIGAQLFAAQGLLFKLSKSIHFAQLLFSRHVLIFLVTFGIFLYRRERLFANIHELKWMTLGGLTWCCGMFLKYYAITFLEFADVFAMSQSGVIVLSLVFGRMLLKEVCGIFEILLCTVIIAGMAMVADPILIYQNLSSIIGNTYDPDNDSRMIPLIMLLVSCVPSAGVGLITRKVADVHYSTLLVHYSFWTSLAAFGFTFSFGTWSLPINMAEWFYFVGFVAAGSLSVVTYIVAFKYAEAGLINMIRPFELPVSYVLQMIFMNVFPTVFGGIGAVVITFGSVSCGVRAWRNKEKKDGEESELLEKGTKSHQECIVD